MSINSPVQEPWWCHLAATTIRSPGKGLILTIFLPSCTTVTTDILAESPETLTTVGLALCLGQWGTSGQCGVARFGNGEPTV